jgi:hypothetical protein
MALFSYWLSISIAQNIEHGKGCRAGGPCMTRRNDKARGMGRQGGNEL